MINRRNLIKKAITAGAGIALAKSGFAQADADGEGVKLLPPAAGVYHGAFPDFGEAEDEVTERAIRDFQTLAGKNIVWAYFSNNWWVADSNGKLKPDITFPKKNIETIWNSNAENRIVPFVRLMARSSWKHANEEDPVYKLQRIVDGRFDAPLERWAGEARDLGIPLIIEFGTEANNAYHSWSGKHHGGGRTTRYGNRNLPDGPERFRDAFRHIIDIFRRQRAKNVTWVFHADARPDPDEEWNQVKNYYPGDDYIDWIGISAYGQQTSDETFMTFEQLVNNIYPQIQEASANRPVAILEFGIRQRPDKAKWISDALDAIKNQKFPRIKAVSYWNANHRDGNEKIDLRIDSSAESLKAYQDKIKDGFFAEVSRLG